MQNLLDKFWKFRKTLMSCLAYMYMKLYGLELSFRDVWEETYSLKSHSDRNLDQANDLDGLFAVAKDCLKSATDRRVGIADKCKTLLTLSSLLLGLVGFLLPRQLLFDATWKRVLLFLAILALLDTIALLLVFFGVGREMVVSLDQNDADLDSDNLKKSLINAYMRTQVDTDNRTNYLADVFKTARFFFLMAFSMIVVLCSIAFFAPSEATRAEAFANELRGDPRLIDLLRGPKGDKGEHGAGGERGDPAVVDNDAIIDKVVDSPRLKEFIRKASEERRQEPRKTSSKGAKASKDLGSGG